MYIKLLLRLIFGYVRIEVEGYWVERSINICINNNLVIWNLKMEKGTKLYLNIGIQDFKHISKIAKKTRCKVRILKKRGIPFLLDKYKKNRDSNWKNLFDYFHLYYNISRIVKCHFQDTL